MPNLEYQKEQNTPNIVEDKLIIGNVAYQNKLKGYPGNNNRYLEALSQLDSSPSDQKEKHIQDELKKKTNGMTEVVTKSGRIDLLTKRKIIEIKDYSRWTHGLGQLIAYSMYYSDRRKVLCLFNVGENDIEHIQMKMSR